MNFDAAALAMDQLHESYPQHDVILYEVARRELKKFRGVKPILPKPKCPRGCEGTRDGRPVVVRTEKGNVQCSVCGFLG